MDLKAALIDELRIGIIITGARSRIVRSVSAKACEILGREPDEIVGHSWLRLVSRPDYELFTSYERRVIRRGLPGSGERFPPFLMRFCRPNGEFAHVWVTSTLTNELTSQFGNDEPYLVSRIEEPPGDDKITTAVRLALDNSPITLSLLDRSGRIRFSTRGRSLQETEDSIDAETMSIFDRFPQPQETLLKTEGENFGTETTSLFERFSDSRGRLSMLKRAFRGETCSRVVRAYGRYYLDLHVVPITDSTGEIPMISILSTDVTDRELARASQDRLANLADLALVTLDPLDLWQRSVDVLADQLDAGAIFHELNETATTDHGIEPTASAGPPVPGIVVESALSTLTRAGGAMGSAFPLPPGRRTLAAPVGRPGDYSALVAAHRPDPDAEPFTDRDEEFLTAAASVLGSAAIRFAAEREVRYRSTHDAVTGLPNRSWLVDRLARDLTQHRIGVVFIDLDNFKTINDTYGHRAGDQLLREIAQRLRATVRPDDVVGRLAGDEFVVICERVESAEDVERLARRFLDVIKEPAELTVATVRVSASAGVAVSHADLADPDRLLNASDIAMYAAKRAGPGRCVVHQSWMHL
ncbi:diguanylate cyclase [Frankia sp. R43]|nr:diguanylate cyclase [Frankia sp. R43]